MEKVDIINANVFIHISGKVKGKGADFYVKKENLVYFDGNNFDYNGITDC